MNHQTGEMMQSMRMCRHLECLHKLWLSFCMAPPGLIASLIFMEARQHGTEQIMMQYFLMQCLIKLMLPAHQMLHCTAVQHAKQSKNPSENPSLRIHLGCDHFGYAVHHGVQKLVTCL
jgi:hypothetical protein